MGCVYYYKNHKFNSELELDNFLLSKDKYFSKYGDIVFDSEIKDRHFEEMQKIEELKEKNKLLWNDYVEMKKKRYLFRDEEGDEQLTKDAEDLINAIGVNKFLGAKHQYNNILKLLYPYFDPDNYFEGRYEDWRNGEFNDTEIEVFFDGDKTKVKKISDDTELKQMRKLMEHKWKYQARMGDAIHKVLEVFFTTDSNNVLQGLNTDFEQVARKALEDAKLLDYLNIGGNPDANLKSLILTANDVYQAIIRECGENCAFFPEFVMKGQAFDDDMNKKTLFGKIDLLVLDKNGKYHIIDYKTSIKKYENFDLTKKEAYSYLLVTYSQMLENAGVAIQDSNMSILPIHIENFKKEGDHYTFEGAKFDGVKDIGKSRLTAKALEEVQNYMPSKYYFHPTTGNIHEEVVSHISKWAPEVPLNRAADEASTKRYLDRRKVFDKRNENGKFQFTMRSSTGKLITLTSDTEEEMINGVLEEFRKLGPTRHRVMEATKGALEKAISLGTNQVEFPLSFQNVDGASNYLQNMLKPYCSHEWEVLPNSGLEDMEIITLYNKNTKQVDFICISTNHLQEELKLKGRNTLLGTFETDAQAELHFKRLALRGTKGNLELMQMMLAINASEGFLDAVIGNMMVINPYEADSSSASNEQLLMNWNALCNYVPVETDNFNSGKYKLASQYDLLSMNLAEIWHENSVQIERSKSESEEDLKDIELITMVKNLSNAKDMIDSARLGDMSSKIKAVSALIYDMREKLYYGDSLNETYDDLEKLKSRKIRLYNLAEYTLADLKGILFKLQTSDGTSWFTNISKTFKEGQSGNYTDNPGNLYSDTLNSITTLVKEAYQNVRDDLLREKVKLDKLVNDLKQAIGFNYLKENLGFNQAEIYKPLFEQYDLNGKKDWRFKKLDLVPAVYRPLLDHILTIINKNRFPTTPDVSLLAMRESGNIEYYRVPYIKGGLDSEVSVRGLSGMFADKLLNLNPKNWFGKLKGAFNESGIAEEKAKRRESRNLIYKMTNEFDSGEENRDALLNNVLPEDFELNAETLLLKHVFAYSQTKNINEIFPIIQAAAAHLSIQGANVSLKFESDKSYLEDYIRSKIKKESIVSPELQGVSKILNSIKSAASKITLAFAPVQMFYQPLQGLWVDISLSLRNPEGREAFTFNHFKAAWAILASDLFNFSGLPTLCSKLNELYALNDMDINKYVDAIAKNKKGPLYNLNNMMFKFASRPDYYNRLSIFLCLMMADGCLEAHSIVDGELKYDWTKDLRFSKFAEDPKGLRYKNDKEWQRQKSLYYVVANLFMSEGVTNPDGSKFVVEDYDNPVPLPRAYTSKQAEGYKSLADDIYGYYSEENKSLIQATALGGLWLQFKTYWSGKKNLYLQSGGVRMRGSWENYTEIVKDEEGKPVIDENTGKPKVIEYYYDLNEDGTINYDKVVDKESLPPEKQLAPVVQWKGQWQEGIMVTLSKLCNDRHIIRNYNQLLQEDPDMARCYKSNIIQMGYDLALWLVGGTLISGAMTKWMKDLLKENKSNTDLATGCALAAINVAVWTVLNSFLDFNIFDSLGSPLTNWTPFALSFMSSLLKNLSRLATGDLDFQDYLVNISGATRLIKPIFDTIKPEMFRSKSEGGEWQTSKAKANNDI